MKALIFMMVCPTVLLAQSNAVDAASFDILNEARAARVMSDEDVVPRTPGPRPELAWLSGFGEGKPERADVVGTARDFVGWKYVWGGESPDEGFDCSGFVNYVYALHGVALPRTSRQLLRVGRRVPARLSSIREGDLLLFSIRGQRVDHVALYAGQGRMIHANTRRSGVRFDDLNTPRGRWFLRHLTAVRRVVPDSATTHVYAAAGR
jgi:hypothetical protein